MLKKIYLSYAFSLVIMAPVALAMSTTDVASLTVQLNSINTQMNAIKRAWNTERVHMRMAEKASVTLYTSVKAILEKIIASDEFTSKMNPIVDMQFDSIINSNTPFRDIKTENNWSDFFPNLTMSKFEQKLYTAMANKMYCLRLGQKLADKAREIAASIKSAQQEIANLQQTPSE